MDEQQWLSRIDRHMERIDRHMEQGNEHMQLGNELMARNERAFLDLHAYLREATVAIGLMATELRQSGQEWREELRAQRREFAEEMQAQRAALFAILDRLNGQPPPSGA
jgi:cytosine/adenosine deaminase-related metal-dependent hydrolase